MTAIEEVVYRVANMTTNKHAEIQVLQCEDQTQATNWSMADENCVVNRPGWEIQLITSNDPTRFMQEFSIHLIQFEMWWEIIGIQKLWKTIWQHVLHFPHPTMHYWGHIIDSIQQIYSGVNFTTDIFQLLHISNMKEA